jgi:hypothetical protein
MSDMTDHVHMSDESSLADVDDVPLSEAPPSHEANGANGDSGASGASEPAVSCPTVGDWVLPLSKDGAIIPDDGFPPPYLITEIEQHNDGQVFARFLETGKYWPLAQCERTAPPAPVIPPDDVEDF